MSKIQAIKTLTSDINTLQMLSGTLIQPKKLERMTKCLELYEGAKAPNFRQTTNILNRLERTTDTFEQKVTQTPERDSFDRLSLSGAVAKVANRKFMEYVDTAINIILSK